MRGPESFWGWFGFLSLTLGVMVLEVVAWNSAIDSAARASRVECLGADGGQ